MPLPLQSKMLRVLQEQTFQRVGGNETIQTNVRIITATHRDLKEASDAGHFRADLYYRLNVYEIEVPPLRERLDDLELLIDHLLQRASRELDQDVTSVSAEALAILRAYPWPGNIRELQSAIKQTVLKSVGPVLVASFLPEFVSAPIEAPASADTAASESSVDPNADHAASAERTTSPLEDPSLGDNTLTADSANETPADSWAAWDTFIAEQIESGNQKIYEAAVRLTEKHVISRILVHTKGNQVQASELLGITRTTLRNKIKQHGITLGRTVE